MLPDFQLSERKQNLLSAIIKDYISHGEPLGSRTLCKRHSFRLSPATIRNEMAELEDAGLLIQPHTSAGRVPSDKGYRFFVDHLMESYVPTLEENQFLRRLEQTSKAVDAILFQAIRILSDATQSIAVAETPHIRSNPVNSVHMLPIDEDSMVLSLTYVGGIRRQSVIRLSQPVYSEVLSMLTNYLNGQLNDNISLNELFHRIATGSLEREILNYKSMVLEMVSEIYAQAQREEKIYLSGTSHLLKEPEFHTTETAYPILQFLEQDQFVHQLFQRLNQEVQTKKSDVYCLIGYENFYQELKNCSFVATPYFIDTKALGMIGILGPTRMDYAKVMGLLQTVANNLTHTLTRFFS
ncbi:heat-inducible transcription repressor HrcA [bacterium (Candidatus Blackallbacteria) CG17_big_fil_post_rev_8_21_14_2_50_48_46]|uniref:Heat-inducible transcription repressor HrcA n=1 Tax=bacterium (Candidatus Blackallbacteria) CG17_big_fil_post_rev_8_21_14_2_50_48_46 TaxID=2014261 RepID=A0A2M7FYE4_9BACT|nr:MAG: heat-inducible transcription repressor HrcA [bacterium (Candidatus Blackallbacteria) CG18_big_fil_WC_8_21_14_2_50_49_26]PIW14358.1 MAG: heat-inducible transcription repressor HrcA [bacterium (Candidatus Blackallbacteria) CG17_big_fil_post_rev_8_21_14_2_50_48_46]PIW45627.1 MAG: heat-inducible transcription repressor HrcA [bacterium (Candidatus Blackallbacteria) CG13_big_fil_rev_8_21_14_2_50_49_14]